MVEKLLCFFYFLIFFTPSAIQLSDVHGDFFVVVSLLIGLAELVFAVLRYFHVSTIDQLK
jgi:hypothetical protein